ncbi:MAG TPA: hypothetical protein VMT76_11405 [Puia sp.]|nr:hypothetical protein [Puia sp.]
MFFLTVRAFATGGKIDSIPVQAILKNGLRIDGWIKPSKNILTPQIFQIKRDTSNGSADFLLTPENTLSILIADSVFYRAAFLKVYNNVTDDVSLPNNMEQPAVAGSFFLERIVKGNKLNLYIITDSLKTHFIIEDSAGNMQSLQYVRYMDNSSGASV